MHQQQQQKKKRNSFRMSVPKMWKPNKTFEMYYNKTLLCDVMHISSAYFTHILWEVAILYAINT